MISQILREKSSLFIKFGGLEVSETLIYFPIVELNFLNPQLVVLFNFSASVLNSKPVLGGLLKLQELLGGFFLFLCYFPRNIYA